MPFEESSWAGLGPMAASGVAVVHFGRTPSKFDSEPSLAERGHTAVE